MWYWDCSCKEKSVQQGAISVQSKVSGILLLFVGLGNFYTAANMFSIFNHYVFIFNATRESDKPKCLANITSSWVTLAGVLWGQNSDTGIENTSWTEKENFGTVTLILEKVVLAQKQIMNNEKNKTQILQLEHGNDYFIIWFYLNIFGLCVFSISLQIFSDSCWFVDLAILCREVAVIYKIVLIIF